MTNRVNIYNYITICCDNKISQNSNIYVNDNLKEYYIIIISLMQIVIKFMRYFWCISMMYFKDENEKKNKNFDCDLFVINRL